MVGVSTLTSLFTATTSPAPMQCLYLAEYSQSTMYKTEEYMQWYHPEWWLKVIIISNFIPTRYYTGQANG